MSGQVVGTLPSGEALEGEFNTGHSGAATWGQIPSSNGTSASGSAVTITGTRGSLILVGKSGLTIQCEYVTNYDDHPRERSVYRQPWRPLPADVLKRAAVCYP